MCLQLRHSKCSAHNKQASGLDPKQASCLDHAYQLLTPTSGEDGPCRQCVLNTNVEERCSACNGAAASKGPFLHQHEKL